MVNKVNINMNESALILSLKGTAQVKKFPQLHKMEEIQDGRAKLEYRYNCYEIKTPSATMAVAFLDNLNKLIYQAETGKELWSFLISKGYKTSKKFYTEDCGMTEELWNQWNGVESEEE